MVNDPQEIMLEHLRSIRSDLTGIKTKLADLDKRFSHIERQIAGMRGDMAIFQEMNVDQSDAMRRVHDRLDRLERHAGLTDAYSSPA